MFFQAAAKRSIQDPKIQQAISRAAMFIRNGASGLASKSSPTAEAHHDETVYTPLNWRHMGEAATVLANNFAHGEPMMQHLGLGNDILTITKFMTKKIEACIDEDLSTVAIEDGKVVGVFLASDSTSPEPELPANVQQKLLPILELEKELRQQAGVTSKQPVRTLHQMMIALDKPYASQDRGNGSGRAMTLYYINMAQAIMAGFNNTFIHTSSPILQKMTHDMMFKRVKGIEYDKFTIDHVNVFAGINASFQQSERGSIFHGWKPEYVLFSRPLALEPELQIAKNHYTTMQHLVDCGHLRHSF